MRADLEINPKKRFMMLDCNSIIFKNIMFIIIFYLNPLLSNESIYLIMIPETKYIYIPETSILSNWIIRRQRLCINLFISSLNKLK